MIKCIKKPEPLTALQWTGDNIGELAEFLEYTGFGQDVNLGIEGGIFLRVEDGRIPLPINTWVIKNSEGAISSRHPDMFNQFYQEIK
jgi:hypothetical protein